MIKLSMKEKCPVCESLTEMIANNVFYCKKCETEFYHKKKI